VLPVLGSAASLAAEGFANMSRIQLFVLPTMGSDNDQEHYQAAT
jgi:hypothetical protein